MCWLFKPYANVSIVQGRLELTDGESRILAYGEWIRFATVGFNKAADDYSLLRKPQIADDFRKSK